ncbi:hypothetical protein NUACC26_083650 [Scytonema sp. NUACC26]
MLNYTFMKHLSNDVKSFRSLNGLKVLVVDDNSDSLELIRLILEGYSVQIATATSTREALKVLAHWEPDVLISDIAMPGEDGYSLMRQVRILSECGQCKHIPAIAITALITEDGQTQAFGAGFDVYTQKPVDPDGLGEIVAELVGNNARRCA